MRFKSKLTNGYQVFAVSGVNTISFAIDAAGVNTAGLLAINRIADVMTPLGATIEEIEVENSSDGCFVPGFVLSAERSA